MDEKIMTLKQQRIISEYEVIAKVMAANGQHKTKSARQLGIDRKTLYNKMNAYNRLKAILGE